MPASTRENTSLNSSKTLLFLTQNLFINTERERERGFVMTSGGGNEVRFPLVNIIGSFPWERHLTFPILDGWKNMLLVNKHYNSYINHCDCPKEVSKNTFRQFQTWSHNENGYRKWRIKYHTMSLWFSSITSFHKIIWLHVV